MKIDNQTWMDELSDRDIQRLDWWHPVYCDGKWSCEGEPIYMLQYMLSIGVPRWVHYCKDCYTGGKI